MHKTPLASGDVSQVAVLALVGIFCLGVATGYAIRAYVSYRRRWRRVSFFHDGPVAGPK